MEYLVTMTTHVPDGVAAHTVDDTRAREAIRSRELAVHGDLLRLWRPPLQPGEWRTLGLFSAADELQLEKVLASMPLRVWRTDEPMPLAEHPNDPGRTRRLLIAPDAGMEFLTILTINVPEGTPARTVADTEVAEAAHADELAQQGHLLRLWTLPSDPGQRRALGLWSASGRTELARILRSLPLYPWMTIETTPLTTHPNDPGLTRASS
ncbi:MAG TPA: muconolactone Delta-isomerase family protein [Jatrophihabitantaceae bacterium]|nr:muconolactone Delta-isomerase family protein [Jatrophihabitantaceae bacterium]